MPCVPSTLFALAAASVLLINYGTSAYGHDLRQISAAAGEAPGFAEIPAPGVRIIREKDYAKRPAYYLSSSLYTVLASGRETGNRFVSFDFQTPPQGGPQPHTHRNEWETFFVVEGDVTFTTGVEVAPDGTATSFITEEVPAGTVVYGPQGPIHGFQNLSDKPARIYSFAVPAGLDVFFETAGERVKNFTAPIPTISLEEIVRTAFWAEQRGDGLFQLGTPPPPEEQGDLKLVISSITDPNRPRERGRFGEELILLVTQEEVGRKTGATAFCGPGLPGRPGGTVDYAYFTLPPGQGNFPPSVASDNVFEVYFILSGELSLRFGDGGTEVTVPALTYVEIQQGHAYSIANKGTAPAESLAISVIAPESCPDSLGLGGLPLNLGSPTGTAVASRKPGRSQSK
jgi:mannose-6-phosphate isomerase-like protein (cupin superfamily)